MSYFTSKKCNEWDIKKALAYYMSTGEKKTSALAKMRQHLEELSKNVNLDQFTKKKLQFFMQTIPPTNTAVSSTQDHTTYNMNDHSNVNNFINDNGKRLKDIFNSSGGEKSDFVNKLLKTSFDKVEEIEPEDDDEEENLQENVDFNNEDVDNIQIYTTINEKAKAWKADQIHQPAIHKQNLFYYNIIDFDPDNSVLSQADLSWIEIIKHHTYVPPAQLEPLSIKFNNCTSFETLQTFYNDKKQTLSYTIKKIIKVYLNQRYEENVNLFGDYNQKEDDYKFHFIAPLFKSIFRHNKEIKKEWGESFVGKTKVDGLLSVLDDEGVITMLAAVEISGPWSLVDNNHFQKDRKKLAKNLKLMMNKIYKLNPSDGPNITRIKLYGIQVYRKQFFIYSLQMIFPKFYRFKKELSFGYPTSPALFRSQLSVFMNNMLAVKNHIESSLESVLSYLNDTDNVVSSECTSFKNYTDSTDNSPQKKKN